MSNVFFPSRLKSASVELDTLGTGIAALQSQVNHLDSTGRQALGVAEWRVEQRTLE